MHSDIKCNFELLKHFCKERKRDSSVYAVFILPGDVGSQISTLGAVFRLLMEYFDSVCYVPGNHDLWQVNTGHASSNGTGDSIDKLREVLTCARACGVNVGPLRVEAPSAAVTIFPLYSWYHSSWDSEPEQKDDSFSHIDLNFQYRWSDFYLCKWPTNVISEADFVCVAQTNKCTSLADAFASLNEHFLIPASVPNKLTIDSVDEMYSRSVPGSPYVREGDIVVSFSHFVPRPECTVHRSELIEPMLSRVFGSDPLEAQIRRLKPHVHIFGHTHIPADLLVDGIRYIQWPLGSGS